MEEKDLIRSLQARDHSAYAHFVDLYSGKVFNTCLGILQSREDAEDVSQEVFIAVVQSIGSFEGKSSLSTWVYRICLTKSYEHIRSKRRKKRFGILVSLFHEDTAEPIKEIGDFTHPGVLLENKERAKLLFTAIRKLPENQQKAFVLHKVEGLSYREIAEIMELSLSSIESLLFRAGQNLRKLLDDYYRQR